MDGVAKGDSTATVSETCEGETSGEDIAGRWFLYLEGIWQISSRTVESAVDF